MSNPRRPLVVMACGLLALAAAASAAAAIPSPRRALFVWGEQGAGLARWARGRGVDTLLYEIPSARLHTPSTRTVLRGAARQGLRVWALSGRPEWSQQPQQVRRWVRAAARLDGVRGIVLDVEPYLLPGWDSDRERSVRDYLRMLRAARRAASPLPLIVAIPFWFDHDAYRSPAGTLAQRVADRADGLVVMAYRDSVTGPDGVLALAGDELAMLEGTGKTGMIALQTAPDRLDKLTFHEEGERALETAIARIEVAFAGLDSYSGIALHHYDAYRKLRR